ncbi:flavodoxin domain-containing protein [Methanoplanus endosymbiosus]|uniref:Flavodoxin domain-containing protein n=1 Tax=Methanoplanus endosymbiosus TaxID=33865 RepID=A0A9E7PM31_9EURY|nr:flavodoxin domain-containing protein [Methanoplanus endosymbiosus]UUX92705.1 flavodoxin domain-containing protein [Methanoplanus endosymbiosus]
MIKTDILLDFIELNTGKPLSSPRALFKTGDDKLFGITESCRDRGSATLRTEEGEEFGLSLHTAEQLIELLLTNPVVALDATDDEEIPAYIENLTINETEQGSDSENIKNTLLYISDLIVLSGIASYGWAKTPKGGNKFRAIAIRRKKVGDNYNNHNHDNNNDKSGKITGESSKSYRETEAERFLTENKRDPVKKNPISQDKTGTKDTGESTILITYATKHGSTADIAWTIRNSFFDAGYKADVKKVQDVEDIRQYSLIVMGTPIYEGKLMPEAEEFVKLHRNYLNKKNAALFITGYSLRNNDYKEREKAEKLAEKISQHIDLVTTGYFGGKLDAGNITITEKISSLFREGRIPGDYRDWHLIGEWADGLRTYI